MITIWSVTVFFKIITKLVSDPARKAMDDRTIDLVVFEDRLILVRIDDLREVAVPVVDPLGDHAQHMALRIQPQSGPNQANQQQISKDSQHVRRVYGAQVWFEASEQDTVGCLIFRSNTLLFRYRHF